MKKYANNPELAAELMKKETDKEDKEEKEKIKVKDDDSELSETSLHSDDEDPK